MKLNQQWRTLSRDEKQAWRTWAKNHPVYLENGYLRRVSGHKAFTITLNHRAIAGEAAAPTVVPAPVTWLSGALSLNDAGPYTMNDGYIGFRAAQNLPAGTKWFVWATPPVDDTEHNQERRLRFVKCLSLGALLLDELTPNLGPDYLPVCGSWDGPGGDGAWPADMFIWFRVHQYANGQLGPGEMKKGWIQVEL